MSRRPHLLRRVMSCALVAAALAVVVPAIPASAADVTVAVNLGSTCLNGTAPDGPLTVSVARTGAATLSTDATAESDFFLACFKRTLQTRDQITVVSGAITHRTTVPRLDGVLDRDADRFSGHAGKGTLTATENLCTTSLCIVKPPVSIPVKRDGTFSKVYGPPGVGGSSDVQLTLSRKSGDVFFVRSASTTVRAPGAKLTQVTVQLAVPGTVTVTVKNAAGRVKGTGTGTFPADGQFHAVTIKKNGAAVTLAPGDRVSTSVSKEARVKLLPSLTFTATAADDEVQATCIPNQGFAIEVLGPLTNISAGLAAADGSIDAGALDFQAGDQLRVTCWTPKGDQVVLTGTAS